MTPDGPSIEDWYARSLKKMEHYALIIAALGVAVLLVNAGWRTALGFACGAAMSHFNFWLWKRVVANVGEPGGGNLSMGLVGLRYLLIGGAVFAIIKVLDVSALAVLVGLLVTVAAALTEIIRQWIRGEFS